MIKWLLTELGFIRKPMPVVPSEWHGKPHKERARVESKSPDWKYTRDGIKYKEADYKAEDKPSEQTTNWWVIGRHGGKDVPFDGTLSEAEKEAVLAYDKYVLRIEGAMLVKEQLGGSGTVLEKAKNCRMSERVYKHYRAALNAASKYGQKRAANT
jgi:hypothetical protein